ncbi:sulfotransferase, putative [Stanieria cyanosphaera PCC 7437]|uniref:Sulfotransferase, putative n=1 Tax=Stanieria cyanosphaera (strain ATCC 29371 / PCC 7437) TaxID=111780 RepID=K9Y1F6_STAC7|nr:sulfotransferase [Stanieria cyanosphaera]AFZ37812.1 sulfotransferase, putative [Stanieria cyanosphaera PCC 7437]
MRNNLSIFLNISNNKFSDSQLYYQYKKLERKLINLCEIIVEKKIISGKRDYKKFLILCRSRTGSNFLVSLLQSHPQIRAFGEVFTEEEHIYWGYPGYNSEQILQLRKNNPIEFLNKVVYRETFPLVSAVGFKLFYDQAKRGQQKNIWGYLQKMSDVKIIHLKRKNILEAHVSHKLAERNNQWILLDNQKELMLEPIALDYDECLQAFEQTKIWETEYEQFFAKYKHPIQTIYYEELVSNTLLITRELQNFLEVNYWFLNTYTKKQNQVSLRDKIINYDELKDKFSKTIWSKFFE